MKFKNLYESIGFCLKLSWDTSRIFTVLRLVTYLLKSIIPFTNIYLSKLMLDALFDKADARLPVILIVSITLLALLTQINLLLDKYLLEIHNELIGNKIDLHMLQKISTMDISFFDSPDYLNSLQAVMRDSAFISLVVWNVFSTLSSIVSVFLALSVFINYNVIYSFLLLLVTLPSAIVSQRFSKSMYEISIENINDERQIHYVQTAALNKKYAYDIRQYNLTQFLLRKYKDLWNVCFNKKRKIKNKELVFTLLMSIAPEICIFFFLLSIIGNIMTGNNTAGDFTLYSGLFATFTSAMSMLVNSITVVYKDKLKIDTFNNFLARKNLVEDHGSLTVDGPVSIEFKNVTFRYPGSESNVLDNISFKIHPSEKVCLIGINGAGKSTIIKLILRFYDIEEGIILLNGNSIKDYNLINLRESISTFFQDYNTYAFTVLNNICLSDLDADEDMERINRATSTSGLDTVLQKHKITYKTYLHRIFDENGYEPSGGEGQKISLARSFYQNCSIMIFDEPSSALDAISENNLFEGLQSYWADKTTLYTSHKLSNAHIADRILLLENGRITESGTHEQLMVNRGTYSEMYSLQAEKFRS